MISIRAILNKNYNKIALISVFDLDLLKINKLNF
jgi:hypothetical protein